MLGTSMNDANSYAPTAGEVWVFTQPEYIAVIRNVAGFHTPTPKPSTYYRGNTHCKCSPSHYSKSSFKKLTLHQPARLSRL